ncbi:MAG: rubrerythrin family protein [Euryarchaeota archaeon]|nr:rubrerythrin family protein [Euryarchaeota archaeon]
MPELKKLLTLQRNEITEYHIYRRLAGEARDPRNREVLMHIAGDELRHYNFWKRYTRRSAPPDRLRIWVYTLILKIFGITFGVKLLERGEKSAQRIYEEVSRSIPEARRIIEDENEHERQLIALIDEERLRYVGSMVLGLNDALVELTGALAGFTFALQSSRLVAAMGLITGIAASLSMAASEYLSVRAEGGPQNPLKAAFYTGAAYVAAVVALVLPFLLLENLYLSLALTFLGAVLIILLFTFYISVAKDLPFRRRFLEMAGISLGVALLSFGVGILVRALLGVEVG